MMLLNKPKRKVRYGVVGLGHIAQAAVLPAFQNAQINSELVALVSRDQEKLNQLADRYHVKYRYLYSELETCLKRGEVDALYICTPNSFHRNIMETAAKYGVHVLCEKPMAVTTEDCLSMISEAQKHHIYLMIAYRLHFQTANLEVLNKTISKQIGAPKIFNSIFTMQVKDSHNIRLESTDQGGGPLYDIGLYCINAARHLFDSEPVEVFAMSASGKELRFKNTEESVSCVMKFPEDRLATFSISFGTFSSADYDLIGTKGRLRLEKAYRYATAMKLRTYRNNTISTKRYAKTDQFSPEILYFSDCIQKKRRPVPSGEEGLADIKVIEALLLSLDLNSPITLDEISRRRRLGEHRRIPRPSFSSPKLFHITPPDGKH